MRAPVCGPQRNFLRRISAPVHPAKTPVTREPKRVENSGGITASLQGRYASALFDLASEKGLITAVESDLDTLGEALKQSTDLAALIRNPRVGRDAAAKAMEAVAGVLKISDLTKNFVGVLAANRRLGSLGDIIRAFAAIAAAQRGEVNAEVTSAHPLTDTQLADLAAKLKAREGKEIKLKANVDPEILGGLVVRIGSRQIDGSIRTRLNSLAQAMKG
jgi:F-type H+-transporting ATPase subunit delta